MINHLLFDRELAQRSYKRLCRRVVYHFAKNLRISSKFNLDKFYSRGKKDTPAYNKSLCKWGHFEKAKTTFKMLLATWFLVCFFKRFRSFVAENLESVGQKAAKLLAIKFWEWFDSEQTRLVRVGSGQVAGFSWDLQLWQLVTMQPFNLQGPNFQQQKI